MSKLPWQCPTCRGRGKAPVPQTQPGPLRWTKCPECAGVGALAVPPLLAWPARSRDAGSKDVCDQCGEPGKLYSFELADDEPILCASCLEAIHGAIGRSIPCTGQDGAATASAGRKS